ncbi:MAG: methyltransferase domain-containing protein, partial [Planctomycetota bacterium]|nr:methyltransferase domain-containing protein [Planctomycetota bacterium]
MEAEHRNANLACWDERVAIHLRSDFYDVPAFLSGRSTLREFETEEVGPVADRSLLHLQCHFGLDTLSWARLGARVTGLDFSPAAVAAARDLARQADIPASFVQGDVLQADRILGDRRFDIVYTGLGALCWLDDLRTWSDVASKLVRPGGFLYLAEFHPVTDMF